jgi:hypothetical protein
LHHDKRILQKEEVCHKYQQAFKHGSCHHGAESHFNFCNKLLKKRKESACSAVHDSFLKEAVHDSGCKANMLERGKIKSVQLKHCFISKLILEKSERVLVHV